MNKTHDIFGPGSNLTKRVVTNHEEIAKRVVACRHLELKIVLTSGTFDMTHEGHWRYLEQAKMRGDVVIVGVDNDEKVRVRKGANRPFDHENTRTESLCHCRHVDLVFVKKLGDDKWQLIKTVRPDVLIATEDTYDEKQIEALKEFCGEVIVLPPQAATSTSAKIRLLFKNSLNDLRGSLRSALKYLDELSGGD